jgi:hypothetical protein
MEHFLLLPFAMAWKYAVLASPFNSQFCLPRCLQYSSSFVPSCPSRHRPLNVLPTYLESTSLGLFQRHMVRIGGGEVDKHKLLTEQDVASLLPLSKNR